MQPESDSNTSQQPRQIVLNAEQEAAVGLSETEKVSVITGGPGTGKTTIIRKILDLADNRGERVLLCAPTGKAAKRMEEQTGRDAGTVHRMLAYSPRDNEFQFNETCPVDADLVVVDETSMVDLPLMDALLKAIDPKKTRLVIVGDADQLPSVGPGRVLADIIESGVIPVTRLSRIYRQTENSWISINAKAINEGRQITVRNETSEDFYWFDCETPELTTERLVSIVCERLPQKRGFDPLRDIQVLAPQYRGACGVDAINKALQAKLNPPTGGPQWKFGDKSFQVNDRVMQIKNSYDLGVMNGEVGIVVALDDSLMVVDFSDREVAYTKKDAISGLVLAFCATVHKAQGSQFKVVVFACHSTHSYMLARSLLYTAITRAEKIAIILGDLKGLNRSITNADAAKRNSGLAEAIRAGKAA